MYICSLWGTVLGTATLTLLSKSTHKYVLYVWSSKTAWLILEPNWTLTVLEENNKISKVQVFLKTNHFRLHMTIVFEYLATHDHTWKTWCRLHDHLTKVMLYVFEIWINVTEQAMIYCGNMTSLEGTIDLQLIKLVRGM